MTSVILHHSLRVWAWANCKGCTRQLSQGPVSRVQQQNQSCLCMPPWRYIFTYCAILGFCNKKRQHWNCQGPCPRKPLQELHRLQVKHLVWYPGNTNSLTIWRSSDPQNIIWESLDLCKESHFKTFVHLDLAKQQDSISNQ